MANPPAVHPPAALYAQFYQKLKDQYVDPMFVEFRRELAKAASADQAFQLIKALGVDSTVAVTAQPVTGIPVHLIQEQLDAIDGFHYERIRQTFSAALGVDITPMLTKQATKSFMYNKLKENINLINNLSFTNRNTLKQKLFKQLQTAPFDQSTVRKAIQETFTTTTSRLKLITRDQTSKTIGGLTEMRQTQLGVRQYIWRTSLDERVRPSHQANSGKTFDWGNPPPDTGHPGHDVQCRCVAEAVISSRPADMPATLQPVAPAKPAAPIAPLKPAKPAKPAPKPKPEPKPAAPVEKKMPFSEWLADKKAKEAKAKEAMGTQPFSDIENLPKGAIADKPATRWDISSVEQQTTDRRRFREAPMEGTEDAKEIPIGLFRDEDINREGKAWFDAVEQVNKKVNGLDDLQSGPSLFMKDHDVNAYSLHWYEPGPNTMLKRMTRESVAAADEGRVPNWTLEEQAYLADIQALAADIKLPEGGTLWRGLSFKRKDAQEFLDNAYEVDDVVYNNMSDSWTTRKIAAEGFSEIEDDVAVVMRIHDPDGNQIVRGAISENPDFYAFESEVTLANDQYMRVLARRDIVTDEVTPAGDPASRRIIEYDMEIVTAGEAEQLTAETGRKILRKGDEPAG